VKVGLPEVSLVAILDADKGISKKSSFAYKPLAVLRNLNGKAIMYADKITNSMQKTIDETT
jgi:excinuclease ABC subunit B